MPRYAITERAGRFVAGHTNTGVGTVLTLTEKEAEHEVRLGTLVSVDLPAKAVDAEDAPQVAIQTKGKRAVSARAKAASVTTDASD